MSSAARGFLAIEQEISTLAAAHPGRIGVRIGYEESLAKRVLAGADILAAPARFEPCGLTQMYAMRFGTVPVVRRVGGLADTVVDHDEPQGPSSCTSTGFAFDNANAPALVRAIRRAADVYREPAAWSALQQRGMRRDFRWRRAAERYLALYMQLARCGEELYGDVAR